MPLRVYEMKERGSLLPLGECQSRCPRFSSLLSKSLEKGAVVRHPRTFVSRAAILVVDVLTPKVGLIVRVMLSYWFSTITMKSVGSAALRIVEEVHK